MLKKKNAMELSINMIILVIIGLIVLVVIMAIFGKQSGNTVKTLESCPSRGGSCVSESLCSDGAKIPNICPQGTVGTTNIICCVKV